MLPYKVNTQTLHKNITIPVVITNNSDNKVCIPINITIETSEEVNSKCYNINEITLTTCRNSPVVCVVLALDSWKSCSGEQAQQSNICKIA